MARECDHSDLFCCTSIAVSASSSSTQHPSSSRISTSLAISSTFFHAGGRVFWEECNFPMFPREASAF